MRYLGIDYGTSKVGIALSDEAGTMGFPREVLQNNDALLDMVATLMEEEGVGAVVIGESLNYVGSGNPVLEKARAFAQALKERTGASIAWEPEMMTTQEARRGLDGTHPQHVSNKSRERSISAKSSPAVDASAAALILTSYLSRHDRT